MGAKAVQKKAYILEQAEKIFAKKGYKNVTMKDIVLACNISRGGVYCYFSSISELFETVIQLRSDKLQTIASRPISDDCSATERIQEFLDAQKFELLHPTESLVIALYEYLFIQSEELNRADMERNFREFANQLAALIQYGVDNGEFSIQPLAAAQNVFFFLEGLRISSTVLVFNEEFVDRQIEYIFSQLRGYRSEGNRSGVS